MKNLILNILILLVSHSISSQSYRVEIDSLPYDTLTEYTSFGLEKAMETPIYFEFEQEFEFDSSKPKFSFSNTSLTRLQTCHPDIQKVIKRAMEITTMDFMVLTNDNDIV